MKNSKQSIFLILQIFLLAVCFTFSHAAETAETGLPEEKAKIFSLQECVKSAIYNSFEVKMAKLDLLIAETDKLYAEAVFDTILFGNVGYTEDKRQELSVFSPDDDQSNVYSFGVSKKLPTGTELTATFSDTRTWSNTVFVTRNPAHMAELTIEGRQPVGKNFFGYVDRNTVTITKLAIKNADLETKTRIEAFIATVEKAYWELVFAKRSLDFQADILEKARNLHEINIRNYDIGLIERGDFVASEANVQTQEGELIISENYYRRSEENLKLLMNMTDDVRLFPGDDFYDVSLDNNLAGYMKEAFAKRRDYKVKKRDVEIKNITLKMKDNEKWPEIDLVGTWAMNGVDSKFRKAVGKTTVDDNSYYYAGIEVSMPIENSMARSEFEKASFEKEKAILALKETERNIITEIGNSFRDVIAFKASSINITEAARLQAEKLKEEEKRFNQGRSNTKRLIDYQQDLRRAELEKDRVKQKLEDAKVDLDRNMNVILEKYEELL